MAVLHTMKQQAEGTEDGSLSQRLSGPKECALSTFGLTLEDHIRPGTSGRVLLLESSQEMRGRLNMARFDEDQMGWYGKES